MAYINPDYYWIKQLEEKNNKVVELSNLLITRNKELIKAIEKISFLEKQVELLTTKQLESN
tara:strand:- start:303 stop:485 length:183 start_codon:yes stop_codon:yes gene_type:complete